MVAEVSQFKRISVPAVVILLLGGGIGLATKFFCLTIGREYPDVSTENRWIEWWARVDRVDIKYMPPRSDGMKWRKFQTHDIQEARNLFKEAKEFRPNGSFGPQVSEIGRISTYAKGRGCCSEELYFDLYTNGRRLFISAFSQNEESPTYYIVDLQPKQKNLIEGAKTVSGADTVSDTVNPE